MGPLESYRDALYVAVAAALAIFLTGWISSRFIAGVGLTTLVASMGASAVILFVMPTSPVAQPWALVGGHILSGMVGLVCAHFLPLSWESAALAVGSAVLGMQLGRCLHPPGGASALIPVLGGPAVQELGFSFLLTPLALNVAIMWGLSAVYRRLISKSPRAKAHSAVSHAPSALQRLGLQAMDVQAALAGMHTFVDVSVEELQALLERAALSAYRREVGDLVCADIMSHEVVTAEFGDTLQEAWTRMRMRGVRVLPVIDRGQHVIGILTYSDFLRHAASEGPHHLSARLKRLLQPTSTVTSDKPEVVGQIMSTPVVTVRQDTHIAELAPLMTRYGYHRLPVVDARNKLVGLVTQSDLIAATYRLGSHSEVDTALLGKQRN